MHRAWQVIHEAKLHLGIEIKHVVVTTDETDQEWMYVHTPSLLGFPPNLQYRLSRRSA